MPDLKNPPRSSDEALLRRFAAARADADFAELVRRHLPLVLAVTRRRLGNSGLAEDAAQQVFIALSAKAGQIGKLPSLAAWLQKAAVFEASCLARKESRHQRRAAQSADLRPQDTASADLQALDQALASLPRLDRQILVLHHFDRLTFAEIGRRLSRSEAAVQRRGHRALGKLAKLIQARGVDSDQAACSTLIAAAFAPGGAAPPPALLARISSLKKTAVLPWLPLATAVTLAGGTAVAVKTLEPESPPPPLAATAPDSRERPPVRPFQPRTPDDKLSDAVREFIALAQSDTTAAWEFAKRQPQGAEGFLPDAVLALADRDLPAADRLLEVIDGDPIRQVIIANLFESRARGNLESAIIWIDTLDDRPDRKAIQRSNCRWVNTEHLDHDYAGALGLARQPEVRNWLLTEACEKAADLDETRIESLAATLEGDERRLVLGYFTSLLLQRGDPRGYDLLDEVKPDDEQAFDMLPNLDQVALRDPRPLLDWITAQSDGRDRNYMVQRLWHQWGRVDARAAAAWWRTLSESQIQSLKIPGSTDATVSRLIEQP